MKKKILALLLSIVLSVGGVVGLMGTGVSAAAATPATEIKAFNLSYRDALCIKVSVSLTNSVNLPKLLYWTAPDSTYDSNTADGVLSAVGTQTQSDGSKWYVFDYTGIAAKEMGSEIYFRPVTQKGGVSYYGEVKKISVLEYAYNILGKIGNATFTEEYCNLVEGMLEYGALAQIAFSHNVDRLVNGDYYYITTQNGTMADGTKKGLYKEGDSVSLVADAANFSHWETADGRFLSSSATTTVTAGKGNDTYVAVYGSSAAKVAFLDKDGRVISTATPVNGTVSAPAAPVLKGLIFIGWDANGDGIADTNALTGITSSKNLTAVYATATNQIFFDYTETDDALVVTVSVAGNVNFAGVEMHVTAVRTGLSAPTVVSSDSANTANIDNSGVIHSAYSNAVNVTSEVTLYTLTFAKTAADVSVSFDVTVDMFNQNDQTVSYTVANSAY